MDICSYISNRSASAVKFWKICLHRSHKTHMYPTHQYPSPGEIGRDFSYQFYQNFGGLNFSGGRL